MHALTGVSRCPSTLGSCFPTQNLLLFGRQPRMEHSASVFFSLLCSAIKATTQKLRHGMKTKQNKQRTGYNKYVCIYAYKRAQVNLNI